MDAFPFTDEEWAPIEDVADSILRAGLAENYVFRASLCVDMINLLQGLRNRHGDHPVILETIADYLDDKSERAELYRRAIEIAELHNLPTLTIRLSFAGLLVEIGDSWAALEELRTCGGELPEGKEEERHWWRGLLKDAAYDAADNSERVLLYRRAMEIATVYGQPTLYTRLLLTRFFLDEGNPTSALEELVACRSELPEAEEDEQNFWRELLKEILSHPPQELRIWI